MLYLPLGRLRAVEVSNSVAGAYAGRVLADLGAELIKLESAGSQERSQTAEQFARLNRNKLSLLLDESEFSPPDLFHRLLSVSNFLVSDGSLPPAVGPISPEHAAVINPRLTYVSVSPTGLASSGLAAAAASLATLFYARMTGEGQQVGDAARLGSAANPDRFSALDLNKEMLIAEASGDFFEPVSDLDGITQIDGVPFRFAGTPTHIRFPAPRLGQHNAYVLREVLALRSAAR